MAVKKQFGLRHERPFLELDKTEFQLVTTEEGVKQMVARLLNEPEIAVDLEHDDFNSYRGTVCLVQISTRTTDFVVDALRLQKQELKWLARVFNNSQILKVFHAALNDVQWLQKDFGISVVNMFDTQLAAKELGMKLSLAHLIDFYAGAMVDKSHQRADWTKRPLLDPMIEYARGDTHYLLDIYDRMHNNLLDMGVDSLNKVLTESALRSQLIYVEPGYCPKRWKRLLSKVGGGPYTALQRAVFQFLDRYRDEVAKTRDKSVSYILTTKRMVKIAKLDFNQYNGNDLVKHLREIAANIPEDCLIPMGAEIDGIVGSIPTVVL